MGERGTKRPPKLGEVLERSLRGSGLMRRVQEQKLLDSWGEVVGEVVARKAQPIRVKNRVLQVKVSNSVWMQQLQFMKGLIIEKLHGHLGKNLLEDVRFFMGEICPDEEGIRKKKKEDPQTRAAGLNEEERERIAKEVAGVRDPEMRDILSKVFLKGLAAEKNRKKK